MQHIVKENAYKVVVGIRESKTLLGRPGCRWEGNIKVDLKEIGWDDVDWVFCLRTGSKGSLACSQ
jgi:hypothetical protein